MPNDALCPKTVPCDLCQQVATIEIIHIGDRMEDTKRGDKSQRIPLTINCPACGRHLQPWRE